MIQSLPVNTRVQTLSPPNYHGLSHAASSPLRQALTGSCCAFAGVWMAFCIFFGSAGPTMWLGMVTVFWLLWLLERWGAGSWS